MSKRLRVVRVDWLDACGGIKRGWRTLDELKERKPVKAVAFGLLLHKDEKSVVICPHVVGDQEGATAENVDGDGEISIPTDWVQKITNLGWL